ncbi:MAG: MBL fold metallo-hydrolase, partial [Candidatus Zixiibacteriota bacterium]
MPEVRFLGHSCVTITEGKYKLIIDPFVSDNPKSPVKASDIDVNYVLLTHGHGDHVGDAIEIAKRNNATIIANFELANLCAAEGAQ